MYKPTVLIVGYNPSVDNRQCFLSIISRCIQPTVVDYKPTVYKPTVLTSHVVSVFSFRVVILDYEAVSL